MTKVALRRVVRAGFVAAVFSGIPSGTIAIVRGEDPLASTRAIGSMVVNSDERKPLVVAVPLHFIVSLWWAAVISRILPSERRILFGGLAGVAIAFLDLRVIGRAFERIRGLPFGPQLLDHIVFGAIVGRLTRSDPAAQHRMEW